ncbi:MAG: hypothetical protein EOM20_06915 [Spartobacteria bacterium]|nr:hypothetical protein [Spartobacteria bacterium]
MQTGENRRWLIFWAVFCVALTASIVAYGTTVRLYATVTYSLLNHLSNAPLADGSVVYIMGSSNAIADPPLEFGGGLIAMSTTGDDTFIGSVRIGEGVTSNGTFFTSNFEFDSDQVKYVYLRFFEYTNGVMIEGTGIWWNTSPTFSATNFNPWVPVVAVDFVGQYAATNRNDFVIIPEPGVGALMLLCGGFFGAACLGRTKKSRVCSKN